MAPSRAARISSFFPRTSAVAASLIVVIARPEGIFHRSLISGLRLGALSVRCAWVAVVTAFFAGWSSGRRTKTRALCCIYIGIGGVGSFLAGGCVFWVVLAARVKAWCPCMATLA